MPTSIHVPKPLLEAVDRRAKALRISRNQLVLRALEREVAGASDWSEGFFEALAPAEPEIGEAIDALAHAARRGRRSKKAIDL